MQSSFILDRLGLPDGTRSAALETRLDGKILGRETRNTDCGSGFYSVGIFLYVENTHIRIDSWTVFDSRHVRNFWASITPEGKLLHGEVNCFTLGMQALDQGYLDEIFSELGDTTKWDTIEMIV